MYQFLFQPYTFTTHHTLDVDDSFEISFSSKFTSDLAVTTFISLVFCSLFLLKFCEMWIHFLVCPIGLFGAQCDRPCHCANHSACSFVTGECSNGCDASWSGSNCNIGMETPKLSEYTDEY